MDTRIKIILLLTLFLTSPVSAKFICGEVISLDETTPSWYNVKTYLATTEIHSTSCQVSPSNNRYCCDLDAIKAKTGYQWKAGDIFKVKITDQVSGYFATPKNLTLTGQGYDVAPVLTLEEAIKIIQPNTTLTISENQTQVLINISSNCINTTPFQSILAPGKNNITIQTTCNDELFITTKTFFQIQNITFQKTHLGFNNNNNLKIKSATIGTIKLTGTLSHDVENIQLKEYIPSTWQVSNISDNGAIEESTSQYNIITWTVNNNTFDFSYDIKSPDTGIRSEEFTFKTMIDQYNLEETTVEVYRFIPLPIAPKTSSGGGYVYVPEEFSKVSQELPLIYEEQDLTAALYSRFPFEQESLNLLDFLYTETIDRRFDYLKSYRVQTTLNSSERGKIIVEYKTNKTFLEENDYKEIGFFEKHKDKFLRITGAVISSNGNTVQYRLESDEAPSEIFIFAEKNSITFLDRFLNFLDKLKFW